jgi:hypothetical protein
MTLRGNGLSVEARSASPAGGRHVGEPCLIEVWNESPQEGTGPEQVEQCFALCCFTALML